VGGQLVYRTNRKTVVAQFTIVNLREILPEVIPGEKIDPNREVKAPKCYELRDYFINNPDTWIFPPIIVDTELDFTFDNKGTLTMDNPQLLGLGNTKPLEIGIGILNIPISGGVSPLIILDGQHRVCGLVMALNEAEASRKSTLESISLLDAQEVDVFQQGKRKELAAKLALAENTLQRCASETITVEIKMGVPLAMHKDYFVTIADKSTGINKSERARLDQINMSSLVAKHIVGLHDLLKGEIGLGAKQALRVDDRNNMAKKNTATIYSLDNIRNVVKNLSWSAYVKESPRRERKMSQGSVAEQGCKFFDILCGEIDAFKKLDPSETSGYGGKEFRNETLYSSPTILRSLAGAYHGLALKIIDDPDPMLEGGTLLQVNQEGVEKFAQLIRNLNPYMDFIAADDGSLSIHPSWRKTGLFRKTGLAPQSGFQDLKSLADLLIEWGNNGKVFAGKIYETLIEEYRAELELNAAEAKLELV